MSRALFFVACSLSSMACLITREPVYEEAPNVPPSVHGSPTSPMNRVQIVPRSDSPGVDAGPAPTDVPIRAIIRDGNVRQRLEGRVYVNLVEDIDPETDESIAGPGTILLRDQIDIAPEPSSEDPYERELQFTVPIAFLRAGACNSIELHVSTQLRGYPSLRPVENGDIGTGTWFVGVTTSSSPTIDLLTCPRQPGTE